MAEESYDQLIGQSIDELNAQGKLDGSGIDETSSAPAQNKFRFKHPLFVVLLPIASISLGAYLYFSLGDFSGAITKDEARKDVRQVIVKAASTKDQKKVVVAVENFVSGVLEDFKGKNTKPVVVDKALEKLAKDLARTGVDVDVVELLEQREVLSNGRTEFYPDKVENK